MSEANAPSMPMTQVVEQRTASTASGALTLNVEKIVTVTWPTPFADTNYGVYTPEVEGQYLGSIRFGAIVNKTPQGCGVVVTALAIGLNITIRLRARHD